MNQLLWKMNDNHDQEKVDQLVGELDCSETFAKLCLNRNLETADQVRDFIHPDETWFHDPFAMNDMDKLVDRVFQAVEEGERILIYGDYDADGVTSTSILYETLLTLGLELSYYIPDRFKDGYGPNIDRYKEAIDQGADLIITVDNGVAGHEAIEYAMSQGVDVIVTDHHELPDTLPQAYAIVHPKHPASDYPFKELAGAGVALKVAHALLEEMPVEFLDLAAIGTVADMVSLTGENRALVYFGLKQLQQTQRLGLRQLMGDLEIKPSDTDEQSIGFKIAPVINAIGRLDQANSVVELLTSFDLDRIQEISKHLIKTNDQRKDIVKAIAQEASSQVNSADEVNILMNPNWHEGVLGIVASRIVKETGKPSILLKAFPDQGIAKGSARSVEAFDMYRACSEVNQLFTHFGGHQMAAGMTLDIDKVDQLKDHLNSKMKELKKTTEVKPELAIDAQAPLEAVTLDSIGEINQLSPFGMDNPEPTFVFEDVYPKQSRQIGSDKDHLKLSLASDDQVIDSIAFSMGRLHDYISTSTPLSIVGKLDQNEWNGNVKAQLMVEDIRINSPLIKDKRTTQLKKTMFEDDNTLYICFKDQTKKAVSQLIDTDSDIVMADQLTEDPGHFDQVTIVDMPDHLDQMKDLYPKIANHKVVLYFYKPHSLYLNGLPTKEECSTLYKYLGKHPNLPINQLENQLTKYLKLSKLTYNVILKMFLEVNFVKIEGDRLIFQNASQKINLLETETYQRFQQAMKAEQYLIFSSKDELIGLLASYRPKEDIEEKNINEL